jgi:DtxR family Mn-dependent transcriptional regulator
MLSQAEENYLKAIFKVTEKDRKSANTNSIAEILSTSPASVTDMIKRLAEKELVNYQKYKGVSLSPSGNKISTDLIRKHRLWEVFLVEKLDFSWEEVHEIAEQMEHIKSDMLIEKLDKFLDFPKFDPHGDPIPNAQGKFTLRNQYALDVLNEGETGILVGVKNHKTSFLNFLNDLNIKLGTEFKLQKKIEFDRSIKVLIDNKQELIFQRTITRNLYVKKK